MHWAQHGIVGIVGIVLGLFILGPGTHFNLEPERAGGAGGGILVAISVVSEWWERRERERR